MKYNRLTQEQLEEMHEEFIRFLASQGIDAQEWKKLKDDKPEVAEEEIDVFSDVVWERVLRKVQYVEHFSKQQVFLFKIEETQMSLIGIKLTNETIDLRTREGYKWLQKHIIDDEVTLYTSTKPVSNDRNKDIFALIRQGGNITQGELYEYFAKVVGQN